MDNKIKQSLFDIENSIETVGEFMKEVNSFDEYLKHKMLRRAIEREIEIIGEAMNRILRVYPDIKIPDARKIIATRNKIIHGYDEVDDVVIYVIATKHLKDLRDSISKL